MTIRSVLIGTAVFAAAFGLLAWWMSRRKGVPAAGWSTLLGISGVYIGFWAVMENRHWLYVPCVALILASNAIQFRAWRRSGHRGTTTEDPGATPRRE